MTKKAIDTDKFISMWNAGVPISDMVCHFGYSAGGAVSTRASRMGTGIELDPDYFEIACRRVEEATRQPDMFIQPPQPQPVQEGFDL